MTNNIRYIAINRAVICAINEFFMDYPYFQVPHGFNFPPIFKTWENYTEIRNKMDELEFADLTQFQIISLGLYDSFLWNIRLAVWDVENPVDPRNPGGIQRQPGISPWIHQGRLVGLI